MVRKTLPAREKQIREDEWHLFCPGEGCSARLAIRKGLTVTLEPRYAYALHPNYPAGIWYQQKGSGYDSMPRARDLRKVMRDIDRATEGVPPEAVGQVIKETQRRDLLDDVWPTLGRKSGPVGARGFHESTEARDDFTGRGIFYQRSAFLNRAAWLFRPRVALRPGTHTVVCYRCGGHASIKAPIAVTLDQES